MYKKLSTLPILTFLVLIEPLEAIAQQTQPPNAPQPPQWYSGPVPWHMWSDGYGWHFWWAFPLMMLFMVLICGAFFFFFCSARRSWINEPHHWGPPSRMMARPWSSGRSGNDPSHSALQILNCLLYTSDAADE